MSLLGLSQAYIARSRAVELRASDKSVRGSDSRILALLPTPHASKYCVEILPADGMAREVAAQWHQTGAAAQAVTSTGNKGENEATTVGSTGARLVANFVSDCNYSLVLKAFQEASMSPRFRCWSDLLKAVSEEAVGLDFGDWQVLMLGDEVTRGDHWTSGEEDGGVGALGRVCALKRLVKPHLPHVLTAFVCVQWSESGFLAVYRHEVSMLEIVGNCHAEADILQEISFWRREKNLVESLGKELKFARPEGLTARIRVTPVLTVRDIATRREFETARHACNLAMQPALSLSPVDLRRIDMSILEWIDSCAAGALKISLPPLEYAVARRMVQHRELPADSASSSSTSPTLYPSTSLSVTPVSIRVMRQPRDDSDVVRDGYFCLRRLRFFV